MYITIHIIITLSKNEIVGFPNLQITSQPLLFGMKCTPVPHGILRPVNLCLTLALAQ